MENNPLRVLFRVSSPWPEPQLATPQPTAPTENIVYEIPSGMIEQLLANPYAGDGTEHPDMHLIYVTKNLWIVQAWRFTQKWSYEKGFTFIFEWKSIGMV